MINYRGRFCEKSLKHSSHTSFHLMWSPEEGNIGKGTIPAGDSCRISNVQKIIAKGIFKFLCNNVGFISCNAHLMFLLISNFSLNFKYIQCKTINRNLLFLKKKVSVFINCRWDQYSCCVAAIPPGNRTSFALQATNTRDHNFHYSEQTRTTKNNNSNTSNEDLLDTKKMIYVGKMSNSALQWNK